MNVVEHGKTLIQSGITSVLLRIVTLQKAKLGVCSVDTWFSREGC